MTQEELAAEYDAMFPPYDDWDGVCYTDHNGMDVLCRPGCPHDDTDFDLDMNDRWGG